MIKFEHMDECGRVCSLGLRKLLECSKESLMGPSGENFEDENTKRNTEKPCS